MGIFLKRKLRSASRKNFPSWIDGFDISFCFQIFPNKALDKIKSYVKVRDEVLSKILEKCKVRARAETSRRLGCGESRPRHTVDTVRAPGPGRGPARGLAHHMLPLGTDLFMSGNGKVREIEKVLRRDPGLPLLLQTHRSCPAPLYSQVQGTLLSLV